MTRKSLVWIPALLAAILAQGALAANEDGGGVGNGGGAKLAEEARAIVMELQAEDDYLAWCSRVSSILVRQKRVALKRYVKGEYELAFAILKNALIAADDQYPFRRHAYIRELVRRGVEIAVVLEETEQGRSSKHARTRANTLVRWIDFVVKTEREFGRSWWNPRSRCQTECRSGSRCHQGCDGEIDMGGYERALLAVAADEIRVATSLVDFTTRDREPWAVPYGTSKSYLKLAELISAYSAQDIAENMGGDHYGCQVEKLLQLSSDLMAYTSCGDRDLWADDIEAVGRSALVLDSVANALPGANRCGGYDE